MFAVLDILVLRYVGAVLCILVLRQLYCACDTTVLGILMLRYVYCA